MNGEFDTKPNFTFDQDYEKLNPTIKTTFGLLETIISLTSTVTNLIIIVAFIKEPKLRSQTNYYIMSLVSADFIMDLIGIPFIIFKVGLNLILFILEIIIFFVVLDFQ